jgi:hypothetical protein
MEENRQKINFYEAKEFLGDGLEAIHSNVSITTYKGEDGLINWVSGDSGLEISDGRNCCDLNVDLWDKDNREESLVRIRKLIDVLSNMEKAMQKAIPELLNYEKEVRENDIRKNISGDAAE